jgi:hypothetical protein
MTDLEWSNFVDTGFVSNINLVNLSLKISNNFKLNDRDISIYSVYSSTIEDIIKKIKILNNQ